MRNLSILAQHRKDNSMSSNSLLPPDLVARLEKLLRSAGRDSSRPSIGFSARRSPIHVFYMGAHLFSAGTVRKVASLALQTLERFAPDASTFAALAVGKSVYQDQDGESDLSFDPSTYERMRQKLHCEPIEDLRIDFEDGYGERPNGEEDAHAVRAAREIAGAMAGGASDFPPFLGIRIKPLKQKNVQRGLRTLELFLSELTSHKASLPENFSVTLPKVTYPEEVEALAQIASELESALGLKKGWLSIELMIESVHALLDDDGRIGLRALVNAANGRCVAVHFGPHDYAASRNVVSPNAFSHFSSRFAREVIQVALRDTGVRIADGPTNLLPIAPHSADASLLTEQEKKENVNAIARGWQAHYRNIQNSLANGASQGWDLHPAQLPVRYAAVYSFYRRNLASASERLKNFAEQAGHVTRVGQVFDDAAMAHEQLNFIRNAIISGAATLAEVEELTGNTYNTLHRILAHR
jgi:citrate lyase beta subunit